MIADNELRQISRFLTSKARELFQYRNIDVDFTGNVNEDFRLVYTIKLNYRVGRQNQSFVCESFIVDNNTRYLFYRFIAESFNRMISSILSLGMNNPALHSN